MVRRGKPRRSVLRTGNISVLESCVSDLLILFTGKLTNIDLCACKNFVITRIGLLLRPDGLLFLFLGIPDEEKQRKAEAALEKAKASGNEEIIKAAEEKLQKERDEPVKPQSLWLECSLMLLQLY